MANSMSEALRAAQAREFERILDKGSKEFAEKMGPVHMSGVESVPMKVLGEEFQKSARHKVN